MQKSLGHLSEFRCLDWIRNLVALPRASKTQHCARAGARRAADHVQTREEHEHVVRLDCSLICTDST